MVKSLLRKIEMTNFLTKLDKIDNELNNSIIHEQVEEVKKIDQAAASHTVLQSAPAPLGILPDQFEELLEDLGEAQRANLRIIKNMLDSVRQYISLKYGIWSLPNLETASAIKNELHVSTALEIMAGNAYWSKALQEVGIKTVATDSLEWAKSSETGQHGFIQVEDLSAIAAIKKYPDFDLILCSWSPNFGHSDTAAIKIWQEVSSSKLLFIGEKNGATNSPEFWENTSFNNSKVMEKINKTFISYDFIDERIFEIDRNRI